MALASPPPAGAAESPSPPLFAAWLPLFRIPSSPGWSGSGSRSPPRPAPGSFLRDPAFAADCVVQERGLATATNGVLLRVLCLGCIGPENAEVRTPRWLPLGRPFLLFLASSAPSSAPMLLVSLISLTKLAN